MSVQDAFCPLCHEEGGAVLWRGPHLRIIEVDDADYPGYTRVIWNAHIAEMTSLSNHGRNLLMSAVYAVEEAQRLVLAPDKINLAALGNMVPHLHWHIIPRWQDDRHFPDSIWAKARVPSHADSPQALARRDRVRKLLPRYRERLVQAVTALG